MHAIKNTERKKYSTYKNEEKHIKKTFSKKDLIITILTSKRKTEKQAER